MKIYTFDGSALIDRAAAAIDEVYSGAEEEWSSLYRIDEDELLERHELKRDSALTQELRHITGYRIAIRRAGKAGAELRSRTRADVADPWPPEIIGKSFDVKQLWSCLAAVVTHPRSIARLEDLLFTARFGSNRSHALRAVESYEASYGVDDRTSGRCAALLRAWELTRLVGDSSAEFRLRGQILTDAKRELKSAARPGVVLPLVATVSVLPRLKRGTSMQEYDHKFEDEVDDLIESAFSKLTDGRFASELVELKKPRLRSGETLASWRRREVEVYAQDARSCVGFVKQFKLEEAVRCAKRHGLHSLAKQLIAEMQRIPRSELQLQRFTSQMESSIDLAERVLSGYTESADWRAGLHYFLSSEPPTGDVDWLRRTARESRRQSVLSAFLPVRVMNRDRMPTWTAKDENDTELHAMSLPAEISARYNGAILAEGLTRIAHEYSVPTAADLVEFFSIFGSADVELAEVVSRSFLLFWAGDYDASAHLIIPRVETAARQLLIELDVGVYNIHLGESSSGYPLLSSLLDELESLALDPSWTYFLRWLLISPVGPNLRNEVAHGLSRPIGSVYAALILRAATLLTTLTRPNVEESESSSGNDLGPLQPRTRRDLLTLLSFPVPDPIPFPFSDSKRVSHFPAIAKILRIAGRALVLVSRRL